MNLTEHFAERLAAIEPGRLTERDLDQVRGLLLDFAGGTYGAVTRPWVAALHRWAARMDGTGKSLLIGGRALVPPAAAALVNGTAAHGFELDDTHDPSLSHPGSVVIPAALAVAAETGASGAEVIAAIVAGYEAMTRVGEAASAATVIEEGHHPTALFGGFGAATASARLYGLGTLGLLHAWGHTLSLAGGAMQFSDEPRGTDVKRIHAGYAAQSGVLAAEMAKAGINAPERALDGKYGFLALYGRPPRPELLAAPREALAIHEISFKPYACCRQFHAAIDGLAAVTNGFSVEPAAIRAVTVRGPRILRQQHMLRRPTSSMAAQYSLPYTVGATLARGPAAFDAFEAENLADTEILRWADMLEVEDDPGLEAQFPAHFGAEVEIRLADGGLRRKRVLDSAGTPANPLSRDYLLDKAARLSGGVESPLDLAALERAIEGLAAAPDIGALTAALRNDGGG